MPATRLRIERFDAKGEAMPPPVSLRELGTEQGLELALSRGHRRISESGYLYLASFRYVTDSETGFPIIGEGESERYACEDLCRRLAGRTLYYRQETPELWRTFRTPKAIKCDLP